MCLSVVVIEISLSPDITELFESLLAHENNNDLSILFEHVLQQLLIDFIYEDLLVDVILSL